MQRIELDDLSRDAARALLAEHLADMHATSPPDSVHALDLAGLTGPDVTVWTLWDGATVLGCAALRQLAPGEARRRGYARLSLETGTQDSFARARRLYERHGFVGCPPFGEYTADPNSAYFTLTL